MKARKKPAMTKEQLEALSRGVSTAWRAERWACTVEMARKYLDQDRSNPWIWLVYADVLTGLARYGEARDAVRSAIRLMRGSEQRLHHAYVIMGDLYREMGRFALAERWYRKAVDCRPWSTHGYFYLGDILARRGKLAEAEKVFRQAARLKPLPAMAFLNLGNVLRAQGRYKAAANALQKALDLEPEYREAREGLKDLETALAMKPGRRRRGSARRGGGSGKSGRSGKRAKRTG